LQKKKPFDYTYPHLNYLIGFTKYILYLQNIHFGNILENIDNFGNPLESLKELDGNALKIFEELVGNAKIQINLEINVGTVLKTLKEFFKKN
jgi:hypothetical protein